MSAKRSAGILGAGISGLSTAWYLQKSGFDVTVYEKKDRVGGVIQTHRDDSWLVENGPNTMLVREQKIWDLLDELNLTNHIATPGDEAKNRFIVKNGTLCPVPMGVIDFLCSDLLSTAAKLRLLKEPFVDTAHQDDESIARFIRRRLGPELLDYAVNPFIAGIYAGDPKKLSIKHTFSSLFEMEQQHGSMAKGFFKKSNKKNTKRALLSFDKGMVSLPRAMQKKLGDSVKLNTEVKKIMPSSSGWTIQLASGKKTTHPIIVSTLPAHQLDDICPDDISNQSVQKLAKIDYAPMSVLALGFRRSQINHPLNGFGMLVPEKEPYSLLGCLFSSSLFTSRAPDGYTLLTCFIGGARHPKMAVDSTKSLISNIMPALRELLQVQGEPVYQHHTFWSHAIPQYKVGYDQYLNAMKEVESANPGFFLAGNYRGGASVPDCILNGFEVAEKIQQYL